MDNNLPPITEGQQSRAFAAWYGVQVGLCWVLSFGLAMWGLREPMACNFALITGFCSIPLAIRLLRDFGANIAPLRLRRAWHMAWMMYLCACLITAAAQYIYFAYLDDGALLRTYTTLLSDPMYQPMLETMLPGQDIQTIGDEITATLTSITPAEMTFQLGFWNVLLATILAIPTALFSFGRESQENKTYRPS